MNKHVTRRDILIAAGAIGAGVALAGIGGFSLKPVAKSGHAKIA